MTLKPQSQVKGTPGMLSEFIDDTPAELTRDVCLYLSFEMSAKSFLLASALAIKKQI